MSNLSPEQQLAVTTIQQPTCVLLKIPAVAGSGKTHTLKAIAIALQAKPSNSLYTAFQKAVITEGQEKLSSYVDCRTLHSLAYKYIYPMFKTEVHGNLSIRMLPNSINTLDKTEVIESVEKFFTSSSTTLDYFNTLPDIQATLARSIVNGILDGEYPITFNFMLKYFHLGLLDGSIKVPPYKLLMLDEAGDTTGVILEIFKLIKAEKKVMAGDPQQNIYTFMNTINGFEVLSKEGTSVFLTKSFRVSSIIAKEVQTFVRKYLDSEMVFEGVPNSGQPTNIAYISSTNATLIRRMFTLIEQGKSFQLIRKASEIFALPLAVITASSGKQVYNKQFKYLEKDYRRFTQQTTSTSFLAYLKRAYPEDIRMASTIGLLTRHGYPEIFKLYSAVKNSHAKKSTRILTTAFTSKGMTFDSVYIEDDLNTATVRAEIDPSTPSNKTTLRLAYTAVTRARLSIFNCKFLELPDYPIDIILH